jgi:replication factor C subunit 2/4
MSFFVNLSNSDKKLVYNNKFNNLDIKTPWVEKYRPKISDDILLDPFIKKKIDNIVKEKSIPNMIITGEPGTGKTSTIICLAQEIYGNKNINEYVLELNASDDRGLSIINNTILPFCKKKTDKHLHKLVILDEADSITTKAQNLLSNIIAEYRKNTRFVFICNDCSQITESIQSRCMIIKYGRLSKENIINKVKKICELEKVEYTEEGINELLFLSDYDIRQVINNLECIFYSYKILNIENINKIIDQPKPYYIEKILINCINGNLFESINTIKELYNKGYTPNDILLTFMKCLIEKKIVNLNDETILKIYEIVSLSYIRVNGGNDTLLQLIGCISKIYLYLGSN